MKYLLIVLSIAICSSMASLYYLLSRNHHQFRMLHFMLTGILSPMKPKKSSVVKRTIILQAEKGSLKQEQLKNYRKSMEMGRWINGLRNRASIIVPDEAKKND